MSDPIAKPFDDDDLERVVTDADKLIMAETILAWADLDTGISRLILLAFGLDFDAGSILIGNMDLKTKVEKMKLLYDHHGLAGAESLKKLTTAMQHYSACRNTVAHRKCVGRLISEPTRLVFLSARHIKRLPGQFEMLAVDHSELIESAKFARNASNNVNVLIGAFETGPKDGLDS